MSATRAKLLLSAVRPRDAVGKARKQLAQDYTAELQRLDARGKELKKNIAQVLTEHPTTLRDIDGVGPINAAKILAETGDVRRFPSRHHFASYTGTAPIEVSSGDNNRHRRKRDQGKITPKRSATSNVAYRRLVDDLTAASPGGQVGASLESSAAGLISMASTSEQSLPGLNRNATPIAAVLS